MRLGQLCDHRAVERLRFLGHCAQIDQRFFNRIQIAGLFGRRQQVQQRRHLRRSAQLADPPDRRRTNLPVGILGCLHQFAHLRLHPAPTHQVHRRQSLRLIAAREHLHHGRIRRIQRQRRQRLFRRIGDGLVAVGHQPDQCRHRRSIGYLRNRLDRRQPHGLIAALGRREQCRKPGYIAACAEGSNHADLLVGRHLGHVRRQRRGHLRALHRNRRLHRGRKYHPILVGQILLQLRHAAGPARQDRPANRPGANLVCRRHLGQMIVNPDRRILLPRRRHRLGAAEHPLDHRKLTVARRAVCRALQRLGRHIVADPPQRSSRRLHHLRIGVGQEFHQRIDRLGVLAHPHAADHADQRQTLQRAQCLAKHLIHFRVRHRLQAHPRHMRQLLVGQQRRQRLDRVLGADHAQIAAGLELLKVSGAGFDHRDMLLDFFGSCRADRLSHRRPRRQYHHYRYE